MTQDSSEKKQSSSINQRTEQEIVRFEKLTELRKEGFAYPNNVNVTTKASNAKQMQIAEAASAPRFTLAGRLIQIRVMGKAAFAHLLDSTGRVQIYIKKDDIGEENYKAFKSFDIGDIVELAGYAFDSKTGERTVHVESIRILSKCLIPLPEKWHGLSDVETRYRHRYVDLIANPEVRDLFRTKSKIINGIRQFFNNRDFIEVETPVLNYKAAGAEARPFKTHYNALDCEMVLRIATEIPLKKLVVGGLERVYEIGRIFRNEGLSKKHNPEFTSIEFYQAYSTFEDLMNLTEELLGQLLQITHQCNTISYQGKTVDLTAPWPRIKMSDSIYEIGGVDRSFDVSTLNGLKEIATKYKVKLSDASDWGRCLNDLWAELVEPKILNPVFITHHPLSISPLARKNDDNPLVVDRFELFICGMEVANAFSELNDPVDQRERFMEQAARKAAGDHEASDFDEDFVRALEFGLPPTAGWGMGIDRLVMLLTDSATIREVLLFPQLRPE